ncbi:hypothetical protein SPPR111872_21725 [Sphingobacterium prati]
MSLLRILKNNSSPVTKEQVLALMEYPGWLFLHPLIFFLALFKSS